MASGIRYGPSGQCWLLTTRDKRVVEFRGRASPMTIEAGVGLGVFVAKNRYMDPST